jgi:gliding motility-associated-like protein
LLFLFLDVKAQTVYFCEGDTVQDFWISNCLANSSKEWILLGDGTFLTPTDGAQVTVSFPGNGVYWLQYEETSVHGCLAVEQIQVIIHTKPEASFVWDGACVGDSVFFASTSLIHSNTAQYIWSAGGRLDTSWQFTHTFKQLGVQDVTLLVVDEFGCRDSVTNSVEVIAAPEAIFTYSPREINILEPEVTFNNLSTNATGAYWQFGTGDSSDLWNPVYAYSEPGRHQVILEVLNENNCIDSTSQNIYIAHEMLFWVPDVFTPNGDEMNDTFGPKGYRLEYLQHYEMQIYSQWGEIIFVSNEVDLFWDGKLRSGILAPIDTYIWSILMVDENGKRTRHNGTVTLAH